MRVDLPAGTVTLLFTDIEGSTRLVEEPGEEGYVQALAEHRRLLRSALSEHGGVEVDSQGMHSFTCSPIRSRRSRQQRTVRTPFSFQVGVKSDWSPDSSRIMFISTPGEGTPDAQIKTATIKPDGTGLTWLTNYPPGGLRAYGNSYSPDGQWIVLRLEDGDQYAMFKMRSDGTDLTQITSFSSFRPRGMAWGTTNPQTS